MKNGIDLGAEVLAVDGTPVGTVKGVVVAPLFDEITHLVVQWGALFPVDKVIPADEVREVGGRWVRLAIGAGEIGEFPGLEEHAYISLQGAGRHVPAEHDIWLHPPPVLLPDLVNPATVWEPFVVVEWRNLPEASVVLREGLPVQARDGERLGVLDKVLADLRTGAVTHIVVRVRGLPWEQAIPVEWVEGGDEDHGIILAVSRDAVEGLRGER